MAMIDVSRQKRSFLSDTDITSRLPADLLKIILTCSPDILDAVSEAALIPPLTDLIFAHFEDAFPDICARWVLKASNSSSSNASVASSFARILPFQPFLSAFLRSSSSQGRVRSASCQLPLQELDGDSASKNREELLQQLVTVWRLVNFDAREFRSLVTPTFLQTLFRHDHKAVRYVAIRIFCKLLEASDYKLDALINSHVGIQSGIFESLDGCQVDYGFLTLHEHDRLNRFYSKKKQLRSLWSQEHYIEIPKCNQNLTPYVTAYGNALLPRPQGPIGEPPSLVMTPTTQENLSNLAKLLQHENPVLLYGLSGVGKTSIVQEVARELGMHAGLVTLHLNEQTDAKVLLGLYATGPKPGSFQWRPGVLTTAVRDGRWVLIEDLDRAPTEVLSTLLPLIEKRELLIPSRDETIRAAHSFRIFATIRTFRNMNDQENIPNLVGMRFWRKLNIKPLPYSELENVVVRTYPMVFKLLPVILALYRRLLRFHQTSSHVSSGRGTSGRSINLRDLLKWCRRLRECLLTVGSTTGDEPITETTRDWMFMEAMDCFVGSCPDAELSTHILHIISEEMQLSKDRAEHYMSANIPPLEETQSSLMIGRVRLRKSPNRPKLHKSKRPFASTGHSRKLLEQIAAAVNLNEPVLLVGETGIGKTTVIQQLADSLGYKLFVVNLSQQSEVGDLLGGFKPVSTRSLAMPLKEEFEDLFSATGISSSKNQRYLEQIGKFFARGQWSKVSKLWKEAPRMFLKIVSELERTYSESSRERDDEGQPTKRRKTTSKLQSLLELRPRWDRFARNLEMFDVQVSGTSSSLAFSFVEGNLVKAVRNGDWVLLDEINLASPDTLESIADLLTGPSERPSILLSETGEIEKIVAHPNFRIFGAMNPATDIGKKDLPPGIRSKFTELYVRSPDSDIKDLLTIIRAYLGTKSAKNEQAADDIARLYLNIKRMSEDKRLVDGANEVPHFSLRTLTRVLSYVNTISPSYGLRRSLYEGFSMGFLTLLDRDSENLLIPLFHHHLLGRDGNPQLVLSQTPKHPNDGKEYVKFRNRGHDRQYWLFKGDLQPMQREDYIITPFVERNLLNLVRATSTRRFPILIQGPTSAGKTSMIEYLANYTGNKFVRINNHEHTDLQEYLGTYVSGADGKLRFQEGILVQAMRQGHWIVLDELNLAPTDVLEALNRLLDDNREILVPETQEIVRPHENFILFATQNPPGLYGGRKALSRAFRNRFLELHFDEIPEDELEVILQHRSRHTSPSDCRRIVSVYQELSRLRQTNRLFEQKGSFATLRDLFRWALRHADTREEIAANGFMLLAERVRNDEERRTVKDVIEKVFKVTIDPQQLYCPVSSPHLQQLKQLENVQGVVLTRAMRRLYVLIAQALRNDEPVLLVGETGCGKTMVCQLLAEAHQKQLHIVNAHQNTETGDLIGSQRPVRNRGAILDALDADLRIALAQLSCDGTGTLEERLERFSSINETAKNSVDATLRGRIETNQIRSKALFEWSDGALVEAMKCGQFFLLDEISLADDSVLERLNSVLEPQKTLLLAEKGIDNSFVVASPGFQFLATMNPGGDFGKRELSPALRDRFTEIWVPPLSEDEDIRDIVRTKLAPILKSFTDVIVKFSSWFGETFRSMATTRFSVREVLVWVNFVNEHSSDNPLASLVHGAAMVFIDSIGANPSAIIATSADSVDHQRRHCLHKLSQLLGCDVTAIYETEPELTMTDGTLAFGHFAVQRSPSASFELGFSFHAPTTRLNAMRVVRALQMQKPILLEGNPGVGKTTLVTAIAKACGQPLTRINLSDQTDLMDLFGTDLPVEGAEAGNFAWRDAPFLQAMQKGQWVLLDEMNLASQSVLEGLNACLDHRGEVYIAELDQVFKRHPDFRLFAAQNPHHQGGGRKGLPSSFVNRFIVVYADVFTEKDLNLIAVHKFPGLSSVLISQLIRFISRLEHKILTEKSFGSQGGPWEFNLRDALRWLDLLNSNDPMLKTSRVDDFFDIIVRQRFQTNEDRDEVTKLFAAVFGYCPRVHSLYHDVSLSVSQVGMALLSRNLTTQPQDFPCLDPVPRLPELESLMICVKQNMPCILSSPAGFGKTTLLRQVAALTGKQLVVFPLNADVDAMELVGGFEQVDPSRSVNIILYELRTVLQESILSVSPDIAPVEALNLLSLLDLYEGELAQLHTIASAVTRLFKITEESSSLSDRLREASRILERPLVLENPRFEWLDGVIIKALQRGQYLVLDNANLCSSSVLDRLNSLLEPNGFLSVNEHCSPGGEPRIVKPHPDFRVFLTVDPRNGELSRAMRNRAIEIHIQSPPPEMNPAFARVATVEAALLRYYNLRKYATGQQPEVDEAAIDYLSLSDTNMFFRYSQDPILAQTISDKKRRVIEDRVNYLKSPLGSKSMAKVMNLFRTQLDKITFDRLCTCLVSFLNQGSHAKPNNSQPFHPLSNAFLVQILSNEDEAKWCAACFDAYRYLHCFQRSLEDSLRCAQQKKLASMNRLQRSLMSNKIAAVSRDSTLHLAFFLSSLIRNIETFLDRTFSVKRWKVSYISSSWRDPAEFFKQSRFTNLMQLIHWMSRTFNLAAAETFDEAKFQAHLAHGSKLLKNHLCGADEDDQKFLSEVIDLVQSAFKSDFQVSFGLSMELLWKVLRPIPLSNKDSLRRTLDLHDLAVRFDSLRWKIPSSIQDLSKALCTLENAYQIVREDPVGVDDLVENLKGVIESLEAQIGLEHTSEVKPFLVQEFQTLWQLSCLESLASGEQRAASHEGLRILSDVSARCGMRQVVSQRHGTLLQSLDSLACQGEYPWDGKFASAFLRKVQTSEQVKLKALALLEVELPIIGKEIAHRTEQIVANPLDDLNKVLWELLLEVFNAHDPTLKEILVGLQPDLRQFPMADFKLAPNASIFKNFLGAIRAEHMRTVTKDHFIPAIVALAMSLQDLGKKVQFSSLAWIHFSKGTIQLYVPDKAFDPQLQPMTEREFQEGYRKDLDKRIAALASFEKSFTGLHRNERINMLELEIAEIGSISEDQTAVYRPDVTEIDRVQAEFSNILNIVNGPSLTSALEKLLRDPVKAKEDLNLVKENTFRLQDRLKAKYEAYQDMTLPAANLLRCLLIGISVAEVSVPSTLSKATDSLAEATPFVGNFTLHHYDEISSQTNFEFLSLSGAMVSVEGITNLQPRARELILECFHHFNDDWSRKLQKEREAEQARSSLYRFRGGLEDEEELDAQEFAELFPTYEEENPSAKSSNPSKGSEQSRYASFKVAQAHKKIFLDKVDTMFAMRDACVDVCSRITNEMNEQINVQPMLNSKLLAGGILLFHEELQKFDSSKADKSYNFYTDSNIGEVRQLAVLAKDINARFRQLQLLDNIGHMQPLADVLQACDNLVDCVHTEPLAKILPKVERMHAFVYEWQFGGWASKTHGVLPLHNKLTDTIIRWRRLELSTWANLLDMEEKNCQDDAYSWWFVAYQIVIAAPLSLLNEPDALRSYASTFIKDLELYFSSSIIGQFRTRLSMLRQLLRHLELITRDYERLFIVQHALSCFIEIYARFEKVVDDTIQKGRTPIEKTAKEVLLLASWKDTNINALRESARKSHQKLFRLIRKFRNVLGQQMKAVIANGIPDEDAASSSSPVEAKALVQVANTAFERLEVVLPGWLEKNKRLENVSKTVSIMAQLSTTSVNSLDFTEVIDEYTASLNSSILELRKETPSCLSGDNKDFVKHLKTRKRKLFADTLKDLRLMGMKYNLAQDKLSQQQTLSDILPTVRPLSWANDPAASQANYYFHKLLDVSPKVRATGRGHSDDLTGNEVGRSIGFLEGMLHRALTQRRGLGISMDFFSSLEAVSSQFTRWGDFETLGCISRTGTYKDLRRSMVWTIQVINFAIRLVQCHGSLGRANHQLITDKLQYFSSKFQRLFEAWNSLGELPSGCTSEAHHKISTLLNDDLKSLEVEIEAAITQQPDLCFILQHLQTWTRSQHSEVLIFPASVELQNVADAVSTTCDTMLAAVEKVNKVSKAVTMDETEANWLAKADDVLSSMMRSLHIQTVITSVSEAVGLIQRLSLEKNESLAAMGLFAIATPVLSQYIALCESVIKLNLGMHRAFTRMAFNLAHSFAQVASEGFCTPQEKSEENSGETGKVESGTGLGDGEGAEDISKDIQQDEDLSELAQEANKEDKREIEDEKDAVDMADEELEGDMGSVNGADEDDKDGSREGDSHDEDDEELDEEAGEVDDLDPTAVDEKMWNGENEEEADKDQQGDRANGKRSSEEQMAAEEKLAGQEEKEDSAVDEVDTQEEHPPPEEEEVQAQQELSRQEQTAEENDTLALPEDMDLKFDDGQSETSGTSDLDDMSDIEEENREPDGPAEHDGAETQPENDDLRIQEMLEDEIADGLDASGSESEDAAAGKNEHEESVEPQSELEEDGENAAEEEKSQAPRPPDNANMDQENAAPSDVKTSGQDYENAEFTDFDEKFQSKAAQQEQGEVGEAAKDRDESMGTKGQASRSDEKMQQQEQDDEDTPPSSENPFRKLGDALEQWHRQQHEIQEADTEADAEQRQEKIEPRSNIERREFQHLQNDEAAPDSQALGTADRDEAQPIDDSMAIDEERVDPSSRVVNEAEDDASEPQGDSLESEDVANMEDSQDKHDDGRSGVKMRQGNYNREPSPDGGDSETRDRARDEEDIQEASTQLSITHISEIERPDKDFAEALGQWTRFQSRTHGLSLSLTSQLRLILAPSESTKLSGSFRTGKRLNIKRIIPYIASSYKRDKIWMRRAVPTKRTYQILLCVDDSKSMGESRSGDLAMESLVMVSRSLTMLEAGQVGVLGFGGEVFTAHQLTEPFGANAGARVLQNFTFSQDRTDIAMLIRRTIDTFRTARQQKGGNSDLWQLALILSDGLTPSAAHDSIRRLLREAMEERIMIVFIIMDDTGKKKGDSVLQLKEAKFVNEGGESRVVIERYLDTFPFQYYLIVHHLEELPGALAGLLRTWFAEVSF